MFTGVVEQIGMISQVRDWVGTNQIRIVNAVISSQVKLGDSISCNGICLTVTEKSGTDFEVEIMHETYLKTTAKNWQSGHRINLERAMPADGRFDGHIVQGHVDTTGRIISMRKIEQTLYLEITYPPEHSALLIPQGSIAVNGVSLTIAEIKERSFLVALIGYTLSNTIIGDCKTGDEVNLEFDVLGKYVQRQLQKKDSNISESWLHEQGF